MYQKDYILRMIEQLSAGLAAILGSKSKTKIEEYHQLLNGALFDLTGMSEDALLKLTSTDLINIISGGKEINAEKCLALAEMLKFKAEVSQGDLGRSFAFYLKSFEIFVKVLLNQDLKTPTIFRSVNEIVEVIRQYKIPRESSALLFSYYEYAGHYDKAEDLLFRMIAENNRDEIVQEGFAFYARLKDKTTMELEEGNLPLDEVIEGLEVYRNFVSPR